MKNVANGIATLLKICNGNNGIISESYNLILKQNELKE